MRYFYQLLLAFIVVILFTLSGLSYVMIRIPEERFQNQTAQQLDSMADYFEETSVNPDYLADKQELLESTGIKVFLYDQDAQLVYPKTEGQGTEPVSNYLDQQDLASLKSGTRQPMRAFDMGFSKEDGDALATFVPRFDGDRYQGFVAIGKNNFEFGHRLLGKRMDTLVAALLVGGAALVIALGISYFLNQRIGRIRQATKEVADGNYAVRLPQDYDDEIGDLSRDFNRMAASLEGSIEEINRQENIRRQFMLDVAHEMRTPLTTMNGLLEGLRYGLIPEKHFDRSIELVHNETQRLTRLVNQNLDYEKIRSQEIFLMPMTFKLRQMLEDLALQLDEAAKSKEDQILIDCSDETEVYADWDRLRQILFNITQNAIQFTDQGHVKLQARETSEATEIQIIDTGIGMTEEELANIWERFYKADESRKSSAYGESGLGVAIVHELIHAHGAQVEVESRPGQGTRFILTFPKAKEEDCDNQEDR